jgi:hypothetical protein
MFLSRAVSTVIKSVVVRAMVDQLRTGGTFRYGAHSRPDAARFGESGGSAQRAGQLARRECATPLQALHCRPWTNTFSYRISAHLEIHSRTLMVFMDRIIDVMW